MWVDKQKSRGVLNKVQGKTREQLEEHETIKEKEKKRIIALLDLGIRPSEKKERTPEEEWQYKYDLLKGLLEAKGDYYGLEWKQVKDEQEKLNKSGLISQRRCRNTSRWRKC